MKIFLIAFLLQADARPAGPPVPEPPTLHSLGVVWTIQGDANRNAVVKTEVRRAGAASWKQAPPLFRIERGAAKTAVPPDAWLFAGSVVGLYVCVLGTPLIVSFWVRLLNVGEPAFLQAVSVSRGIVRLAIVPCLR